jgi:hypothetical protein
MADSNPGAAGPRLRHAPPLEPARFRSETKSPRSAAWSWRCHRRAAAKLAAAGQGPSRGVGTGMPETLRAGARGYPARRRRSCPRRRRGSAEPSFTPNRVNRPSDTGGPTHRPLRLRCSAGPLTQSRGWSRGSPRGLPRVVTGRAPGPRWNRLRPELPGPVRSDRRSSRVPGLALTAALPDERQPPGPGLTACHGAVSRHWPSAHHRGGPHAPATAARQPGACFRAHQP